MSNLDGYRINLFIDARGFYGFNIYKLERPGSSLKIYDSRDDGIIYDDLDKIFQKSKKCIIEQHSI